MGRIQTEISEGELLDRISILEIKLNKIKNHTQLKEVKKEYEILNKLKQKHINSSKTTDLLYKDLKGTNEKIWIIENEKRLCEKNSDFKEKFIQICRNEYFENDKRAKIKRKINKILDSYIKEVKQHTKY
jgi:post-segregation antitoxin (ccd killing protein)|tara:strand:+ start:656 stop:1045 length:390 start_codon:yes stop_codon:yes gene_type:complete